MPGPVSHVPRVAACLLISLLVADCGGSPTAPTPTPTPTPTPPAGALTLSGSVTNATTGAGIVNASVSITAGVNSGRSAVTDVNGHYAIAGMVASALTVTASAANYVSQARKIDLVADQTLSFEISAPATFIGVASNTIAVPHELVIGTPVPTQNQASTYCCWPFPVSNQGSFTFDLARFPANLLPSGGSSNIVSASEMMIAGLNVSPLRGVMRFEWHRAVAGDVVIFSFTGNSSSNWVYTYIGRFDWEINAPGPYYLTIDTDWGRARLDFLVTESTPAALRARRAPLDGETQRWAGKTGGFGEGRDDRPAPYRIR